MMPRGRLDCLECVVAGSFKQELSGRGNGVPEWGGWGLSVVSWKG